MKHVEQSVKKIDILNKNKYCTYIGYYFEFCAIVCLILPGVPQNFHADFQCMTSIRIDG